MQLIDISPKLHSGIAVWPGDVEYASKKSLQVAKDGLELGSISSTVHVGAHTDAPLHYHPDGVAIDEVPLDAYYGPCQVIQVAAKQGARFGWDDLRQEPEEPRILFQTGTFPDPQNWNNDFAAPDPDLIRRLGRMGVKLVGFDTPSTDLMDSKDLPAHQALHEFGMMNLEGLDLRGVAAGDYTLSAFPLHLAGMDGSPVRAVLIGP